MLFKFRTCVRTVALWAAMAALPAVSQGCAELVPNPVTVDPSVRFDPASFAATIVPGATVQVPVSVRFAGGPTNANLSVAANTLPTGVTASFAPLGVAEGTTSTLTLTADSTAIPGLAIFDVIATESVSGYGKVARGSLTLTTDAPFSLAAPNLQSVTVGTTHDISIAVSRKPGFTGPIALSLDPATLPAGATYSFTPVNASSTSTTLRVTIPASAPTVIHQIAVEGRYGASRSTTIARISLQEAPVPPDITVAGAPATATVAPGGSITFDLAYTRNIGTLGMGNISQSVSGTPPGSAASFTPIVSSVSSTLTVVTTTATPDGTYPITVTATLGGIVKTATMTLLVVTPPDFSLTLNPNAVSVARGASGEVVLGLQRTGAVGDIAIDVQSVPSGVTITPSPAIVNAASSSGKINVSVGAVAAAGSYEIVVRGVAGAITRTRTFTLTIPAPPPSNVTITVLTPTSTVTRGGTIQIPIKLTRTGNAVGQLLELRSAGFPGAGGNAWITPSLTYGDTATLNVIGGTPGTYNVAVSVAIGAFPPTDIASITVTPTSAGDFAITPAPVTLNVNSGQSNLAGLEIGRTNGFAGAVSFTAITDRPSEYQVQFSLNSTTGGGVSMTIYASPNVALGPHVMRLRATSGSVVREVSMTLNVIPPTTPQYPYPYPYPYGAKIPPE